MQDDLEQLRQFATLTGLLVGFSFTGVLQLVSLSDRRRIVSITLVLFVLATFVFLYSLVGFFIYYIQLHTLFTRGQTTTPQQILSGGITSINVWFIGILILTAGVGCAGWIRSKAVGILCTALSFLGAVGFIQIIVSALNLTR